ncbi:MAG: outer membrane lipoprotein carrier protein LolA [Bacteroides sp.]|nr:outer membrane lipoprotein carrier protein LolA [Bacteroides sp.]
MKKICFLICFLTGILSVNAQVISSADTQTVEKIKQGNLKYNTMTANFKHTQHLSFLGEDMFSEGKLYYSKPEKLAMRYTDPEGEMMAINGDKFVMVSMGNRREISGKSNPKMQGMKTILSACMQGDVMQMGASKISCKETSRHYVVNATIDTEANKSGITEVILNYDKNDFSLAMLKTMEEDDNYTIYELTQKKFNQPIAENQFQN